MPSSRSAWNSRSRVSSADEQRADPQDRRADAREEVEVRPDAERHGRDHGEEEDDAGHRPAAALEGEAQVACEDGDHSQPSAASSRGLVDVAGVRHGRIDGARRKRQAFGVLQAERLVRRGDGDAAGPPMVGDELGEARLRGAVQRRCRLVEDPDRACRDEETGKARPPLLAGREIGKGQMRDARQADGLQRRRDARPAAAEKAGPEGEVVADSDGRLHRVPVADIVAGFGEMPRRLAVRGERPLEGHRPADRTQQPRERAQQRRLAGAVRAGDEKRRAAANHDIEGTGDGGAAAPDAQAGRGDEEPAHAAGTAKRLRRQSLASP